MCTSCHTLYNHSDVSLIPKLCTSKSISGQQCGNNLFKTSFWLGQGSPIKILPYTSLKAALTEMFKRDGFEELIEYWRNRKTTDGRLNDIMDGTMWKTFKDIDGDAFTSKPRQLLLCLNLDWFNPNSGATSLSHSTGAMYVTVLNLPREIRNSPENVILLSVIPGRKEPKTTNMNNIMKLVVDDLEDLFAGINITTSNSKDVPVPIRAALFTLAADAPAFRFVHTEEK